MRQWQRRNSEKRLTWKAALEACIGKEQGRQRQKERQADTWHKILAGAAVLDEGDQRPEYKGALLKLLDRFLTRPDDRALFNLPTQLPDNRTSGRIHGHPGRALAGRGVGLRRKAPPTAPH
jgi:hypothetical protein